MRRAQRRTLRRMHVVSSLMEVLREEREAADVGRAVVAVAIGKDQSAIDRLELGRTIPRGRDLDALVDAYARSIGSSPVVLWAKAIVRAADVSTSLGVDADARKAAADYLRSLGESPTQDKPASG